MAVIGESVWRKNITFVGDDSFQLLACFGAREIAELPPYLRNGEVARWIELMCGMGVGYDYDL